MKSTLSVQMVTLSDAKPVNVSRHIRCCARAEAERRLCAQSVRTFPRVVVLNELSSMTAGDVPALRQFLARAGLTFGGLDTPAVRLWMLRDAEGVVQGTACYEASNDGSDVLIRSVAVDHRLRGSGIGSRLAQFTLDEASRRGARRAWLFSGPSGPFWQRLGFAPTDLASISGALPHTHQIRLFEGTGQLHRKKPWFKSLAAITVPESVAARGGAGVRRCR
jgi:N-acetylglutamate synthase-like GNAT family acetyltransferase